MDWEQLYREAETGDAYAQCSLACELDFGDNLAKRNPVEARKWYRLAAQQGELTAMNNLGVMLRNGEGGPADPQEGLRLQREAADLGDGQAMYNYALACDDGLVPGAGIEEAIDYYQRAIADGEKAASASYVLAQTFDFGDRVPVDKKKAVFFYRKAARLGHAESTFNLGCCYEKGEGVRADKKKALELFRLALERGDYSGAGKIGYYYDQGWGGLRKSYRKSFEYYTLAFLHDRDVTAAYNMSIDYCFGLGVTRNYRKGFLLTKFAAKQDHFDAIKDLGWHYLRGKGCPQNTALAREWLNKALEQKPEDVDVLYNLGRAALLDKSYPEAADYFRRELEFDPKDPWGNYQLGRIKLLGLDGERDIEQGRKLLQFAARRKVGRAKRLLLSHKK